MELQKNIEKTKGLQISIQEIIMKIMSCRITWEEKKKMELKS
jgi:hypothetical protein